MAPQSGYWFPAKRYGWGWGPPVAWQGWVVLAVYTVLLVFPGVLFLLAKGPVLYTLYVGVLSLALLGVCYRKGEPPKWRWGGR
jgi:hypothetical protein